MSEREAEMALVIGGARSGKSNFAEALAAQRGGDDVLFLATAEPFDDEMRERIAKHHQARSSKWHTLEAPRAVVEAIRRLDRLPRLVLLDCLTLWVSNELLADETDIEKRLLCELDLLTEWARLRQVDLILVTNEVGQGIVPEIALARRYRDLLGNVNARAAHVADKVYWMVAGLPIEVKQLATRLEANG